MSKKKKGKITKKSKIGADTTSDTKPQSKLSKTINLNFVTWVAAALILAISIIIRYYAFSMPVVGDESVYGILGKKMMMGAELYKDIYEMKPPLLFYVYGISTAIFGWGTTSLRTIGLLLVLFNSFLIFSFARNYASLRFSALVGVICFFFLNNVYAYGTETAAEHFYLSFVLSGYYLLAHPKIKNLSINILIAGFLIAGGAMIKQTAALFGVGAIILVIWYSLSEYENYTKKKTFKNILFLALGAFTMLGINLLSVIISGSWTYAKYWLVDIPSLYMSSASLGNSWLNLELIGGWIINYQFTTIVFGLLAVLSLIVNFREKYFPLLLILLAIGVLIIFPGSRFYGQYWLTLMTILALFMISLKDALKKLKLRGKEGIIISVMALGTITTDTIIHSSEYFEDGYLINAEKAYSGNYPIIHIKMVEFMKEKMLPTDRFLMLGSQPFAYYAMDQFPESNHIYPRMISRNTPENKVYQQQAIAEMESGRQEFILLSVTGLAWQIAEGGIQDWYLSVFPFVDNNYEPILAYNFDEMKFYYNTPNDRIDIYKPNQLVALKKK
jgi:4-amino-4-deoxy-L-arabinose transferase-like glycosyltransferase